MLALGPFPRFAGSTVKNIEGSWKKVVDGSGIEETGGRGRGYLHFLFTLVDAISCFVLAILLLCYCTPRAMFLW